MKTEFEVKILDIDVLIIQKKLGEIGAVKIADRLMKRITYDLPDSSHRWMRLRDEGDKVTLSVKEVRDRTVEGTSEVLVTVSDFESAKEILTKLGYPPQYYQENRRISYRLGKLEFEIDFWPKIPPYLEIEAESAEEVERAVKLLGYEMSDTTTDHGLQIYTKYGLDIHSFAELKFDG